MQIAKLENMTGGWFVGNFIPSLLNTDNFEVAVKYYKAGDKEPLHVHKIATEITVIAQGQVTMQNQFLGAGDMIVLEPGEPTDFEVLEDTITVVVKTPSVREDKYIL